MPIPELPQKKPIDELMNMNTDRSVDPYVLVQGAMGRDTGGTWRYLSVSADGTLRNVDAANFRVSALGVNITDVSNSDAADFRTSAIQGDGGLLRVSSVNTADYTSQAGTVPFLRRSDTLSAVGNGATQTVSASPVSKFAMIVSGNGAGATSWDVRLEGSLDNANFTQIMQHTTTTGDKTMLWSGANLYPITYFRSRVAGVVLGGATSLDIVILGVQ